MANEITKAVILARGLGKRMRRAAADAALDREQAAVADTGAKAMIPVGRPFLDYVLSGLADAGYRDICLVIGLEHAFIRQHYDSQPMGRLKLEYAIQAEPVGTANAVLAAEKFVDRGEFLVMNSDNYYPVEALRRLRNFDGPGTILFHAEGLIQNSNIPPQRLASYAYAKISDGYLSALHEKPNPNTPRPDDALISMNVWRFSPEIFEHCRLVEKSSRGEYELPNAVARAVQHGMRIRVETSDQGVLDLSERADVPIVAERLREVEVKL
jgi:glucose-1-phosphate thymidylyltransferase